MYCALRSCFVVNTPCNAMSQGGHYITGITEGTSKGIDPAGILSRTDNAFFMVL